MTRAATHRHVTHRHVTAAVRVGLVVALVALVGCGDDGGNDSGGDAAGTSSTLANDSSADSSVDTSVDTTAADGDDSGDDDGAAGEGFAFTDPDGRFTAVFPFEPQPQSSTATLDDGTALEYTVYLADGGDSASVASCVDYEAQGAGGGITLEGARDGAISNTGGNLLTSEEITVQGRPAIEFTAAFSAGSVSGLILGRVIADGNVLCQVFVLDVADTLSDESFDFVESFQFTEAG